MLVGRRLTALPNPSVDPCNLKIQISFRVTRHSSTALLSVALFWHSTSGVVGATGTLSPCMSFIEPLELPTATSRTALSYSSIRTLHVYCGHLPSSLVGWSVSMGSSVLSNSVSRADTRPRAQSLSCTPWKLSLSRPRHHRLLKHRSQTQSLLNSDHAAQLLPMPKQLLTVSCLTDFDLHLLFCLPFNADFFCSLCFFSPLLPLSLLRGECHDAVASPP